MNKKFFNEYVFLRLFLSDEQNKYYIISRFAPRYKFPLEDMMRIVKCETVIDFIVVIQNMMVKKMIENEIEIEDTETHHVYKIEPEKAFVDEKILMVRGELMCPFDNGRFVKRGGN